MSAFQGNEINLLICGLQRYAKQGSFLLEFLAVMQEVNGWRLGWIQS